MSLATQIAALEAALEKGVLSVTELGRTVTYPSPEALLNAIARLKAQQRTATTGRGFAVTPFASSDAK